MKSSGPPKSIACGEDKRQEASAYTWARITGGEPLFAPRPIEADQPDHIRRAWLQRRGNTWFQLTRPDRLSHYAALRARLNGHADQIAKKIDDDPCWRHPYVVTAPGLSASLFG